MECIYRQDLLRLIEIFIIHVSGKSNRKRRKCQIQFPFGKNLTDLRNYLENVMHDVVLSCFQYNTIYIDLQMEKKKKTKTKPK